MFLLIIGLTIWVALHLMKRLAPTARAGMDHTFGEGPAKGLISGLLIGAVVLMVIGFRSAPVVPVYEPVAGLRPVTNLLMIVAVVLFGMGNSSGRLRDKLRHPMLGGVVVWGVAHLLSNGDQASVVLFGVLIAWAVLEMRIISRFEGPWKKPEPGAASGDIRLALISVVVFAVFVGVHVWLGHNPFGGEM